MDPLLHLMLPLLLVLALRIDPRKAVLLAPLAILPDFDALIGLHRAALHSFVPTLVLPLALIAYSKLKKPEWMLSALLVQFYLASHIVLDLGGVAFLWPVVQDQIYFEPEITFTVEGGLDFGFSLEYGLRPLAEMGTVSFLSDAGFALLFLGVLFAAVFRHEAKKGILGLVQVLKDLPSRLSR